MKDKNLHRHLMNGLVNNLRNYRAESLEDGANIFERIPDTGGESYKHVCSMKLIPDCTPLEGKVLYIVRFKLASARLDQCRRREIADGVIKALQSYRDSSVYSTDTLHLEEREIDAFVFITNDAR